jgi:hypothetical protein
VEIATAPRQKSQTTKREQHPSRRLALLKLCHQDYLLAQDRQGLLTSLEVGKLALYYYKRAEIARIFASSSTKQKGGSQT